MKKSQIKDKLFNATFMKNLVQDDKLTSAFKTNIILDIAIISFLSIILASNGIVSTICQTIIETVKIIVGSNYLSTYDFFLSEKAVIFCVLCVIGKVIFCIVYSNNAGRKNSEDI